MAKDDGEMSADDSEPDVEIDISLPAVLFCVAPDETTSWFNNIFRFVNTVDRRSPLLG